MSEKIITIESSDCDKFEAQVNDLLSDGYRISSTSCGFVSSEQYDFCSSYHAVLVINCD